MDLSDFIDGEKSERDEVDHDAVSVETDFTPTNPRHTRGTIQPRTEAERKLHAVKAKQRGLGFDGEVLKETIIRKLHQANLPAFAHGLERCHTQQFIKVCNDCRTKSVYYNRCELFYCPCCASRLSNDRRKTVEWWTAQIRQPKHVVLTCRNTETITPGHVKRFKKAFANLRRKTFAKSWRGGFYSIEVTNEGKGWHLHLHALIDANFINVSTLAKEWAKCIGQSFAIVYVKDVREGGYLKELVKYAVKGNQLASWSPEDVGAFVFALKGQRTFGTFGALYKQRKEYRAFLDEVQSDKQACPCGCTEFRIFSEEEWEWHECVHGKPRTAHNVQSRGTTSQIPPAQPQFTL
jgi:hypothetical protein